MPAVMMRSWPRATSALMAIFSSNRSVMYSVTRIRKTIRPVSIFREIVLPHVGPMSSAFWMTALVDTPAVRAREAMRRSPAVVTARGEGVGLGTTEGLAEADAEADAEGLAEADGVAEGATGPSAHPVG